MKKIYKELELEIIFLKDEYIITTSPEVDGDENKYPFPDGWGNAQ